MTKHKVEVSLTDLAHGKKIPVQGFPPEAMTLKIPKDALMTMPIAKQEPYPFHFNFAHGNQIIGQLTINLDGHMTFTGKADMAAREFFDHVIAKHAPYEKAMLVMAAAHKLVSAKGRYHSQLNYEALAKMMGYDRPAVSAWHDCASTHPTVEKGKEIAVLTRWEGIRGECVGWYRETSGTYQHADGTCEGEEGWSGIIYRCTHWTEIPA